MFFAAWNTQFTLLTTRGTLCHHAKLTEYFQWLSLYKDCTIALWCFAKVLVESFLWSCLLWFDLSFYFSLCLQSCSDTAVYGFWLLPCFWTCMWMFALLWLCLISALYMLGSSLSYLFAWCCLWTVCTCRSCFYLLIPNHSLACDWSVAPLFW